MRKGRVLRWLLALALVYAVLNLFVIYFLFRDTTVYAKGYSEAGFRTIEIGMTKEKVYSTLGNPLGRLLDYSDKNTITTENDVVDWVSIKTGRIQKGMRLEVVFNILGYPAEEGWYYSRSKSSGSYENRGVLFYKGKVKRKFSEFYAD